jgi:hypothetical protein
MERLWRDLQAQLADCVATTLDEWAEAGGAILRRYSQTMLPFLTGCTYFVQAVETAWKSENG